jgi:hypothetical protein
MEPGFLAKVVWFGPRPGNEGFQYQPSRGCELRVVHADPVQDVLLLFATHLSALFAYAQMPPLNLDEYSAAALEKLTIDRLSVDLNEGSS